MMQESIGLYTLEKILADNDFTIKDEGDYFLISPISFQAREWLHENHSNTSSEKLEILSEEVHAIKNRIETAGLRYFEF